MKIKYATDFHNAFTSRPWFYINLNPEIFDLYILSGNWHKEKQEDILKMLGNWRPKSLMFMSTPDQLLNRYPELREVEAHNFEWYLKRFWKVKMLQRIKPHIYDDDSNKMLAMLIEHAPDIQTNLIFQTKDETYCIHKWGYNPSEQKRTDKIFTYCLKCKKNFPWAGKLWE